MTDSTLSCDLLTRSTAEHMLDRSVRVFADPARVAATSPRCHSTGQDATSRSETRLALGRCVANSESVALPTERACDVAADRLERGRGGPEGLRGVGAGSERFRVRSPELSRGWRRGWVTRPKVPHTENSNKPGTISSRAGDGNRTRMTSLEVRLTRSSVNRVEPSWPVIRRSRASTNCAERTRSRGWRGVGSFAFRSGDAPPTETW